MTELQKERVAIIMDGCDYTEAQAIEAMRRQERESESRRLIEDKYANQALASAAPSTRH